MIEAEILSAKARRQFGGMSYVRAGTRRGGGFALRDFGGEIRSGENGDGMPWHFFRGDLVEALAAAKLDAFGADHQRCIRG